MCFDLFENLGKPGDGSAWKRHEIDNMLAETRTILAADFNRDGKPDLLYGLYERTTFVSFPDSADVRLYAAYLRT